MVSSNSTAIPAKMPTSRSVASVVATVTVKTKSCSGPMCRTCSQIFGSNIL